MHSRAGAAVASVLLFGACREAPHAAAPASVLALSVPYSIDSLDPHARDRIGDFAVAAHFYEPLVAMDADLGIHPALATRWDNPDALTWVFHLRTGVLFHGGKDFGAEDVVYTLDRLRDDRRLDVGVYTFLIDRVTALDPRTVEIRTRRPTAVLLNKLATVLIVPKGATADSLAAAADGTGPYRLAGFRRGESIRMVRNDGYWSKKPAFAEVTIHLGRSPDEAVGDLLAGRAGFAQVTSRDAEAALRSRRGFRLERRTDVFLKYLGFDLAHPMTGSSPARPNPFLKKEVREAISLAIDRTRLVSELSTFAVPASQIVPPFIFGFNPSLPVLPCDPERARAGLAGAGFPKGFEMTLHSRKLVGEAAASIRRMLEGVGIRVTVVELDEADFYRMAADRRLGAFLTRIGSASGDASDVLETGLHSTDEARHLGTRNFAGYASPSLDREIEESGELLSMVSRRARLQAIMERVTRDVLWVPLYFDEDVYAMRDDLAFRPRADSFVLASEIAPREAE